MTSRSPITTETAVGVPSITTSVDPSNEEVAARPPRTLAGDAWRKFRRHKLAMVGSIVLALITLCTIFGPSLYTQSYSNIDFGRARQAPSIEHPFGTNEKGQDVLARVLWGGRVSIFVGLAAMAVAIFLGTFVGAISGFFGGFADSALMRVTDLFLALPQLPLLLLVIFLFQAPMKNAFGPEAGIFMLIVLVIGALNWMAVARLVRASFLSVREMEFVTAARAIGIRSGGIIWKHILPNVLGPVIVAATLAVGTAIITESTLSFLGLGFPPDTPTWGRLLNDAQNYVEFAPWIPLFPGLAIFLTVLSINYMGDGLRDALDPRLRS